MVTDLGLLTWRLWRQLRIGVRADTGSGAFNQAGVALDLAPNRGGLHCSDPSIMDAAKPMNSSSLPYAAMSTNSEVDILLGPVEVVQRLNVPTNLPRNWALGRLRHTRTAAFRTCRKLPSLRKWSRHSERLVALYFPIMPLPPHFLRLNVSTMAPRS